MVESFEDVGASLVANDHIGDDRALASGPVAVGGLAPVSSPPWDRPAVHAGMAPIDGTCPARAVEQDAMHPVPDAVSLPIAQPPPVPHPRAAAHLPGGASPRASRSSAQTGYRPTSSGRCGRGGRPPFGLGRSGGSSGSITAHRLSDTKGLAIHPEPALFVPPFPVLLDAFN